MSDIDDYNALLSIVGDIVNAGRMNQEDLARLRAHLGAQPASQPSAEEKLRLMLCMAYAGPLAYFDDGEAQDNRAMPFIDFLRDSPDEIATKMRERATALPAASGAEPPVRELVEALSATMKKIDDEAKASGAEPVATVLPGNGFLAEVPKGLPPGTPLYASPVARQPLTEEEILRIVGSDPDAWPVLFGMGQMPEICRLARAIERAHGIAATPAPGQDQADASQADSALVAAARNLLATFDELDKFNELAAIESEVAALREALKGE